MLLPFFYKFTQLTYESTMETYNLVRIIQEYQAEKQKVNQIRQMQELVDIMLRRAITRKDEGQLIEMSKRISAFYLKELFPQKINDFAY